MKKRIITAFLATAMAVSVSATAFAATAVPGYIGGFLGADSVKQTNFEYGTFSASSVTAQKTETLSFVESVPQVNGEGDLVFVDAVKQKEISYAVVPVGAVLSVAPAAGYQFAGSTHTSVNHFTKNSSGAFVEEQNSFKLENGGASFTVPATSAGKLIALQTIVVTAREENPEAFYAYFYVDSSAPAQVTGTSQPVGTTAATSAATYKSDTGSRLNLGVNKVYQFKITSLNGKQPTFNIAGSAFKVTFNGKSGNDYRYLVKAVGKAGQYGGVYINGEKTASTTISIVK